VRVLLVRARALHGEKSKAGAGVRASLSSQKIIVAACASVVLFAKAKSSFLPARARPKKGFSRRNQSRQRMVVFMNTI